MSLLSAEEVEAIRLNFESRTRWIPGIAAEANRLLNERKELLETARALATALLACRKDPCEASDFKADDALAKARNAGLVGGGE